MKVAFFGCHCDDIELGCGATIHKHREDWDVICCVLSSLNPRGERLDKISKVSLSSLGATDVICCDLPTRNFASYRQKVWEIFHVVEKAIRPSMVFVNSTDGHPDHAVVSAVSRRRVFSQSIVEYFPAPPLFPDVDCEANYYEEVNRINFEAKLTALSMYSCYQDKAYFAPENVIAQLRVSGMRIGREFAEAFRITRLVR